MGIVFNYINCLRKYCVFRGRSSRYEYWSFVLINILVSIIISAVDAIFAVRVFSLLYGLAVLLPYYGVSVRRLHDVNRSGWWLLLPGGIGVVGAIISGSVAAFSYYHFVYIAAMVGVIASSLVILYWFIKKGDETSNDYGNP